jgi:hypothetical protein
LDAQGRAAAAYIKFDKSQLAAELIMCEGEVAAYFAAYKNLTGAASCRSFAAYINMSKFDASS